MLGLAALFGAWLLPGHQSFWPSFQQETLAAAGVGLVALQAVMRREDTTWGMPRPACVLVLLALVPPLQWAAGLVAYRADALLASLYVVGLAIAFACGHRLAGSTARFVPALMWTIGAAGLLCAPLALAQALQWDLGALLEPLRPGDRVYANFQQPNHLATALAMSLVALGWTFETRRMPAVTALPLAWMLLVALALTHSRTGWLFAVSALAWWAACRARASLRTTGLAVAVCLGAYAFATFATAAGVLQAPSAALEGQAARVYGYARLTHWQTLADAVGHAPWFGYGWGQVSTAQMAVTLDHEPTFEWLGYSHNLVLDLLVWNGLPLGGALVVTLGWWSMRRARQCTDATQWALLALLIAVGAHAMVEFPHAYAYFLLPAGLAAGALHVLHHPRPTGSGGGRRPASGLVLLGGLTVLAAAAVGAVTLEYLRIEQAVIDTRFRDAGYRLQASVPDVTLLDGQREYMRLWATKDDTQGAQADVRWLTVVSTRYATPPALLRLAIAAASRSDAAGAERALRLLCHLHSPAYCAQAKELWLQRGASDPALRAVLFPAPQRR